MKPFQRLFFWICWPGLYLYFYRSKRSRVALIYGENMLLVKGWWSRWYGDQRWSLPGGGKERQETPAAGAVRELTEELGLDINDSDLVYLGESLITEYGITYRAQFFSLALTAMPTFKRSREIATYSWLNPYKLPPESLKPEVQQLLALLATS